GLAAIRRERLLELARVRVTAADDEAHEDRAAVERFLIVELAASAPELADHWRRQRTACAVREVQTPLARIGIVETQRETLEPSSRTFHVQLHEIGTTIPHLANDRGAFVLDPRGRARQ